MDAYLFNVIRRCRRGECEPDCNCCVVTVNVDVDELTERELGDFLAHGTEEQKAEIRAYLDDPANDYAEHMFRAREQERALEGVAA